MKRNHPKADLYMAEREKGLTYKEIAAKYGVSYQTVAGCCGKHSPGHVKPYTAEEVVYPNLRRWLNDNKVSRSEFARGIGRTSKADGCTAVGQYFRGNCYPQKQTIDKMLAVTGLTYEELFAVDGEET